MKLRALDISEANSYIKRILTNDPILYNLRVKGEISNFKVHSSGNVYLSLKDEKSKLNLYVRSMRNACNVFLNRCPTKERFGDYSMGMGTLGYMIFAASIGELRGNFGVMIGQIAKAYGIDVEDALAQIIPT